jgi:excisionase family DNA binding protein
MEYKALYTVKETAKVLCTGTNRVYALIRSKELPAIKLGEIKIKGTDLEAFINNYPAVDNTEV